MKLTIELEIACTDDEQDAFIVVDTLLDNGVLQDAINDHEVDEAGPLHVISAVCRPTPQESMILNVEGGECTLGDFIDVNRECLSYEDLNELLRLKVGEVLHFGGGAAAHFQVGRVR